MKNLVALTAIAALAACSQAEEPDAVETTSVVEPETDQNFDQMEPGSYVATYPDGSEVSFTTTADGTWTASDGDGETSSGTFEQRDGKNCFTSEPAAETDSCWTERVMNDDGSWTSTNDAGVTVTVRPAGTSG